MNIRSLSLSALSLCLALAAAGAQAGKPPVSPAVVDELSRRPDAPLVLDVRSPGEYAAGHVPGAVLIPVNELESRLAELDRSRWVLVYCRSGGRAARAESLLAREGFDVRRIDGSMQRWEAEQRPVQTGPAPAPAADAAEDAQ